jgi:hypothetical protein
MGTICLAPLGMQPGAVVAPVLSLGLTQGDEIVLLTTEQTHKSGIAHRSEELIRQRLSAVGVRWADVTGDLTGITDYERIILLINGGEAATVHQLTDRLRSLPESQRVEFAESRGVSGTIFSWNGVTTRTFQVSDLGLSSLLKLLHVSLSSSGRQITSLNDPDKVLRVEELLERAGAIYAGVKVEADPGVKDPKAINTARLEAYRSLLRWQTLQQDLGLELRRLFLTCDPTPRFPGDTWPKRLRSRAARDGVPAVGRSLRGHPLDIKEWKQSVLTGNAASLPEQLDASQRDVARTVPEMSGDGSWTGGSVVTLAGTQPGTVLRTLWAHRPRSATLFYDPSSTGVLRNLDRLRAALSKSGATRVEPVPLSRLGSVNPDHGSHVSLSAGDKSTKFRLKLWAERNANPVCYLAGTKATCGDSGEYVPLRSWIQAHTTLHVDYDTYSQSQPYDQSATKAIAAARAVWRAVADGQRLGERGEPPRTTEAAIEKACGRVRAEGFWLEDLAETLLCPRCDETIVSAVMRFSRSDKYGEDELDLLTAKNGAYALWSCKSMFNPGKLLRAARQARAQATKFLGRMELAVVIVPWLGEAKPGIASGPGWWQPEELTWVVDLSFLTDAERLAALAGTRPSGPRGPGRWNPFTS